MIDNHIYLWGYWLLANTLSLFSRTPDDTLKFSAKFLLMSCMLFAVYQKVNPSYLSGDFFYYTLLTDQRFFFISNLIDYNMIELIKENNFLLMDMKSYSKAVIFSAGPHILNQIALFLTWYTIILEGIIFGLFTLPRRIAHQWQHWFLFLFLLSILSCLFRALPIP